MQKLRRTMALVLVVAMMLSMSTIAFAESPSELAQPDLSGLVPGPNVIEDETSPTGYTVKFLYQNDEADSVTFAADILLRNWEDPSDETVYQPEEYQSGFMRGGGAYTAEMSKVEGTDGQSYWYTEVPMAAGANQYWFYIDGNTSYMAPDPNNMPQWSPSSDAATKNAYNAVYVPYDEKQDYAPMEARTVENPMSGWGAHKGTWSYVPITVNHETQYMAVYLPYGYDEGRAEPYKTIYLLHGGGQDESDWMGIGSVQNILDNLIDNGEAEPAVLVSLTFNNNCIGSVDDGYANLFDKIIPYIEANYHVSTDPMDRALAGLSAGGGQTRNVINTDATQFGYYGLWSSSNTNDGYETAEHLDNAYLMFGCGRYDPRDQRKVSDETLAELRAKGAKCTYVEVAGNHDFNAWNQLFTIFARDYLWQPESFADPEADGLELGPNVVADASSPTGYTVKFLYENRDAESVTFAADILLRNWADPADEKVYQPAEYQPGMMRGGGAYEAPMTEIEDGIWYIEVPMAAGTNQYWFYIDGNTEYWAPDPNNDYVKFAPDGLEGNARRAFNPVYVPYDEKQDSAALQERATYENPRDGIAHGTWDYVQLPSTIGEGKYIGVYLPPEYDADRDEPYKLIFMQHGSGQDASDWMTIGGVPIIMDNLLADGLAEPAVVVTTDADYLGSAEEGYPNLINIILPFVEQTYHVSTEAADRAFAGLSMGGGITTSLINYDASKFGYYGVFSAGARIKTDAPNLGTAHILVGAGSYDFGLPGNGSFRELKDSDASYAYEVVAGAHDFNAWNQLFTIFVRDYLWQPEAFESEIDLTGLEPGPNVVKDENSPTGYTVKFLYENMKVDRVTFAGDIGLKNWADQEDTKQYTPFEYKPGLMRSGAFTDAMENIRGYWYYEVPLAAGANQYWFYLNENTSYMAPDPNNMPKWSPNSNAATKNAYNAVYVPYDEKQDYEPMAARAVENPRTDGKAGTWSYVPITVSNRRQYMAVYLPYGYDAERAEPYKTIYMLHGGGQDESDWMGIGSVQNILDNLIAEGKTEPAVLVSLTSNNGCIGNAQDGFANLFQEIIPFVEKNYNVSTKPLDRSLAGLSMGSMNTQGIINTDADAFGYYGPWSGGMSVKASTPNLYKTHIFFGGGASDFGWRDPSAVDALKDSGARYTHVEVCGGHDFNTWCQMFAIYVQDYLWHPEAFDGGIDLTGLQLGPNVIRDEESPTGYTVKFLYENKEAKSVTFAGDIALKNWADQTDTKTYTPFEYRPGLMRSGAFTDEMVRVGDGLWYYEVPLAAGANQYWFYIDGNTKYMAPDPNNMPKWSPNSDAATKNAYNAVYVPYDEKQDYKPMADRAVELPRTDEKKGTWSYVEITPMTTGDTKQYMGVYLPYGYDAGRAEPYKTIYVLHGSGQDESDWMGIGSVQNILDNLIAEGKTEPAVLVSLTFNNGCIGDMTTGNYDNLFDVVIPFVEAQYNVSTKAADRSFSGLSQGARNTQTIIDVAADQFGYFGPWSSMYINDPWGAFTDERGDNGYDDIEHLDQTHILFGVGKYDRDVYIATEETLAEMDAHVPYYDYVTVAGAHDFNTWCQLFAIYVRDYLWQPEAFGDEPASGGGSSGGSSSGGSSTKPEEPTFRFTDSANHWAREAIEYVSDAGIMNGTSASRFSPDSSTTRGMVVTILYRMEGEPDVTASSFTDVAADQYYADAVAWAAANGIVNGYGDGRFGPNDIVTREQLATILYRYAQYGKHDTVAGSMPLDAYQDADQISAYALPAMEWAVGKGLLDGISSNVISPDGNATRAQIATIIMRFCKNIAR